MKSTPWDDNELQFARLLCEWVAAADGIPWTALSASMDLAEPDIDEIFARAQVVFNHAKPLTNTISKKDS